MGQKRFAKKQLHRKGGKRCLQGQITVLLSLLLTVVLLFLLTCTEGVRMYLGKGRAARKLVSAQEDVMADYDRFLWEKYHILAVDESYGLADSDVLQRRMEEYLMTAFAGHPDGEQKGWYCYNLESVSCVNKKYLSEDLRLVEQQIAEYMKQKIGVDGAQAVLQQLSNKTGDSGVSQARERVKETDAKAQQAEAQQSETQSSTASQKADTGQEEQTQEEQTQTEDPRKALKSLLQPGLVELVTGRTDISREDYTMDTAKEHAGTGQEESVEFQQADEITERLPDSQQSIGMSDKFVRRALVIEYVLDSFPNAAEPDDSGMQCQCEYVIAGKKNDYDNIKNVIQRIIAVRFPVNFTYVIGDGARVAEAQSVAAALAGATANPAIVELVTYLLLGCESYAEAVLDTRTLLGGGTVPFWKNAANWNVSLAHLAQTVGTCAAGDNQKNLTQTNGAGEDGMAYRDYLRLLLWLQQDGDVRCERMLRVMEWQARRQRADFQMQHMLFGFETQLTLRMSPLLLQGMQKGDGYLMQFHKAVSY